MLDRLDEQFEFPLPGMAERQRMLQQFVGRYLRGGETDKKQQGGMRVILDEKIDDQFIEEMAQKTEGFSGRQLAKVRNTNRLLWVSELAARLLYIIYNYYS